MSGGLAGPLQRSRLDDDGTALSLTLDRDDQALYSEAVERRHKSLANALGRQVALRV